MVTFRSRSNSIQFLVLGILLRVTPHSCRSPLKYKNCPPADRKVIRQHSPPPRDQSVTVKEAKHVSSF